MMRRWVILNGVLAVIVLALGVQIVRTWARALPAVEVRAPGKAAEQPARGGEAGKRGKRGQAEKTPQTPAALVAAILNKDLFDPSRAKANEDVKVESVAHEPPPPGITLVGVRVFGRDREGFILDATQANTQRRIRQGDAVGSFTVKMIRRSSVVLVSQAGDVATLSLEVEKSKNATAAPARPGRPQAAAAGAGSPAAGSPAAGVLGASPAAGVGGITRPPVVAAGTAAVPPQPPHPPGAPVPPLGVVPPAGPKRPPTPNIPEGVRQKLEQMKGLNKK